MSKHKILHVITHLGVGGALDNTLLTIEGLGRDRFEVHLAAGTLSPDDCYTSWEERSRESADSLFLLPDLQRAVALKRDKRALDQLTALINEQKYDVVHTHCSKAGLLGRIAARRAGVPVIIHTCHAFGWQVAEQPHAGWARRCANAGKRWMYLQLERYAASLSDALITVAELNKQDAIKRRLAPASKITTIYSGIRLPRLQAPPNRNALCRELGLSPERPIIGTIGRLCPQKAPLDFVTAAKSVLQKRPEVQFVMLGDGPQAQQLEQAIGDESRIKMLGFREDGPQIVGIFDVFALSSLWEGLGRALTEAQILGVPSAATTVDGIPELITHGDTGLLSAPGAPSGLAKNILWFLDHPEEAKAIGRRAQHRVVPAFDAEQMVEQIHKLYDRLLLKKLQPADSQAPTTRTVVTGQRKLAATIQN